MIRVGVLDGEVNNCPVVLYMIVFLFVYIVSMEIIAEGKG